MIPPHLFNDHIYINIFTWLIFVSFLDFVVVFLYVCKKVGSKPVCLYKVMTPDFTAS